MQDVMARVAVVAPAAREVLDVFGARMEVLGEAGMFAAEHVVPPGYLVPPHAHEADDEMFWMLDGRLTLLGPEGERVARAGDCVHLPRGSVHGFRNDEAADVRFLVICTPGVQAAEMFRHFDRAGRAAPGGLTPPEIVAICAQYGVHMG